MGHRPARRRVPGSPSRTRGRADDRERGGDAQQQARRRGHAAHRARDGTDAAVARHTGRRSLGCASRAAAPTATPWKGELAMTTALEPELSTYRWSSHDEADRFGVEDPATGEVITLVQGGGTAEVNAAVEAAHRAFQTDWRWRTHAERAE